jgi:hypothetical protein
MSIPGKFLRRNIRTFAGASLTTSFQNVGALINIVGYKITIVNATTTDVQISDGTSNDNYYVPASSTISIGEGVLPSEAQAPVLENTQFQAKLPSGSAGTGILVITVVGN